MYRTEADRQANRLYLDFSGRLDEETMNAAADETVETAKQLSDGFDIINDLTGFRPVTPAAAEAIKRAQAELQEMGVDRVIRVVDEETSEVVVNSFERRSKEVGYSGETADSVEAAERLLDEESVSGYLD